MDDIVEFHSQIFHVCEGENYVTQLNIVYVLFYFVPTISVNMCFLTIRWLHGWV